MVLLSFWPARIGQFPNNENGRDALQAQQPGAGVNSCLEYVSPFISGGLGRVREELFQSSRSQPSAVRQQARATGIGGGSVFLMDRQVLFLLVWQARCLRLPGQCDLRFRHSRFEVSCLAGPCKRLRECNFRWPCCTIILASLKCVKIGRNHSGATSFERWISCQTQQFGRF